MYTPDLGQTQQNISSTMLFTYLLSILLLNRNKMHLCVFAGLPLQFKYRWELEWEEWSGYISYTEKENK